MKKQSALGRLLWLYEPFWRYARGYVILSLVFWAVILPLHRILMVIFPETVVNLITGGYGIQTLVGVVVVFQLLLLGIPIFVDFYNAYGKDKMEAKVELSIKRQVYEKALQTDYRYVDDPKYYHTYMWAIHHQAEKAKEAFALLNRAVSALILIVSLAGIVSMFSPWMVLLTVLSMVLRTYGYMKYNRQDVAREQELMHSSRKLDYYHRIFYMKDYNADLKTTKLRDFVFRHFNHEASHRLEVIHGYAKGLTRWAVFSDMIYRVFMTVIILAVALNLASGDVGEAASYITIMLSIEKMEDAMYEFFELFQQGGKLSLYARDIQAFYHMESQIETEGASSQAMPPSGSFDIKFTHLCFQYAHSDFKIDSLNLHIRAGEKIAIVGLKGAGIVVSEPSTLLTLGDVSSPQVVLALVGLIIIAVLYHFNVKGSILIGILVTWIFGMIAQVGGWYVVNPEAGNSSLFPSFDGGFAPTAPTMFAFDFSYVSGHLIDFAVIVFSFLFVDLFDTAGTLIGVASKANLLDKDGNLPKVGGALMSDAIGTVVGACMGTSTVTSYVESSAGVAQGGRTGLTAVTAAGLFIVALFFSPIFIAIPSFATTPALVFVGLLMISSVKNMDFSEDMAGAVGGFLAIIMMPFTYSIANGIMFGILAYVIIKVFTGKVKDIHPVMWISAALFALKIVTLIIK